MVLVLRRDSYRAGYSAETVRTYNPGDICPHNVGTMSAQHLTKDICLKREMLCGHIFLEIYVRTMSALYPSSVFSSSPKVI